MRIYLDSSALVKKFSKEEDSEVVENLFRKCESGEIVLVVSQWTVNECITAFDKSLKRGETDPQQINSDIIDLVSLSKISKGRDVLTLFPSMTS